jgi:predicted metal-dependent hydrolase
MAVLPSFYFVLGVLVWILNSVEELSRKVNQKSANHGNEADIIFYMKEQRSIVLHGKTYPYQLNVSPRARRLRITVSDSGITLVLPAGFPVREGEAFMSKNSVWILAQMEKHEQRARSERNTLPKDVILLRGTATRVERKEEATRLSRARVEEQNGHLTLALPAGRTDTAPEVLERWLRGLARVEITNLVRQEARRMHASPKTVTIRDQRTRWGSCSSTGTLSFNWRLIMVPPTVMQYVVVHELAHMSVPNHSRDFWNLVSQYYPAYQEARAWLRKNAPLLHPRALE